MTNQTATTAPTRLVIRTADRHLQCRCAPALLGYRAEIYDDAGRIIAASPDNLATAEGANGWAQDYLAQVPQHRIARDFGHYLQSRITGGGAARRGDPAGHLHGAPGIRIEPALNPDFRPTCLGAVLPGDRYIADADSDHHYCLRCGTARAAIAGGAR